jgi:NADPH:quinone reductase-like Zn-dependent oxidoreductase
MRAVIVEAPGPPEVLRIANAATPSPGPGELAIDVEYAGVGLVDALFRSGAIELPTPLTPGIEVSGHVRETGPDVTGFEPGERLVVVGNASGNDDLLSGDAAWLGTRQILGLNLGGVAHLIPDRVGAALSAIVDLVHRDVLREPAPSIVPLEDAAEVHVALEARTAPHKTVLAVR